MSIETGHVMTFTEPRGSNSTMIFVSVLALVMTAASGAGILLPWPPDATDAIFFALVAVLCFGFAGGVVWSGLHESEIRIDRRSNEVVQWTKFLGRERTRRWTFRDFHTVEVREVKLPRQKSSSYSGPERSYFVYLTGAANLRLQNWTSRRLAEEHAERLARFGRWQVQLAPPPS